MRAITLTTVAIWCAACSVDAPHYTANDAATGADAVVDAQDPQSIDAASFDAAPQRWSSPIKLALSDPTMDEARAKASPTGTELYFGAEQSTNSLVFDIYYVTRSTPSDDWGASRTAVGAVNTSQSEGWPCMSPDGRELYFNRGSILWVTKRASVASAWGAPVATGISGRSADILADGLTMYYEDTDLPCPGPGYPCRQKVTRQDTSSAWANVVTEQINSDSYQSVDISSDGLRALLSSPSMVGISPIAIATRSSKSSPWGAAAPVLELSNYTGIRSATWNADETEMYMGFSAAVHGGDLYISRLQ